MTTRLSREQRREIIDELIHFAVSKGRRVESESDTRVVFVKDAEVPVFAHLILTFLTAGFWLIVWFIIELAGGGKERIVVTIDQYGEITTTKG